MTNFNDLEFENHKMGAGLQARIEIDGRKFSIISGDMFYSVPEENSYEVGEYIDDRWEVEGYCSEERVEEILNGSKLNSY